MTESGSIPINRIHFQMMAQNNLQILVFKDIEEISDWMIQKWLNLAQKTFQEKDQFIVAISGGKTPIPMYQKISHSDLPLSWDKTHFFLVDERFIPFDNPDSNFGMIKAHLFNQIPIPDENIHPIYIEKAAQLSAKRYEADINIFFNLRMKGLPRFDLILLGIGEDGHTASLFPKDDTLLEKQHLTRAVTSKRLKHPRITITLQVINHAKNIFFLATGEKKAKVIKDILRKRNPQFPASLVRPENGEITLLLDKQSASLI